MSMRTSFAFKNMVLMSQNKMSSFIFSTVKLKTIEFNIQCPWYSGEQSDNFRMIKFLFEHFGYAAEIIPCCATPKYQ